MLSVSFVLFYFITAYIIGHLFTAHIIRHLFIAHSITGILDIILDIILYLEFHSDMDIAIWDMGRWSGGRHHSR